MSSVKAGPSSIYVATEELLELGEQKKLASVLWRMVRAPVDTAISLSLNPHFRSYRLLTVGVAASVLYTRLLPDGWDATEQFFTSAQSGDDPFSKRMDVFIQNYYSELMSFLFYAMFFLTFLFSYKVYRRYATQQRTAKQYFRLSAIAFGYTSIIALLTTLPAVFYHLSLLDAETGQAFSKACTGVFERLFVPIFYYKVTRRFWGVSFGTNIIVSSAAGLAALFVALALWAVVVAAGASFVRLG